MLDDCWPPDSSQLHLARRTNRCTVLGPGVRAVLWVQGCPFRCPGCVAPDTLPFVGGEVIKVDRLAEELTALPEIEGVTLSGGEPLSQASALVRLIDLVRGVRDLSFMSYTGHTLEQLARRATSPQRELLRRLDILVDGPYVQSRHTNLIWRGSDNQRVLLLSSRYRHLAERLNARGTWLEFEADSDTLMWMGIPPQGFSEAFTLGMARQGLPLVAPGDIV
jgi:anaerobic ribonucleoside-triphosphate reductase activating protein